MANNTGQKVYQWLREFNTITGLPTGRRKPNDPADPDYIPPVTDTVSCPLPVTYIWVEDTYTCEQTTPFSLIQTTTGFSSPGALWWDVTSSRYVVVDIDDVNGNCYTFNPDTLTSYADRNVIPGLAGDHVLAYDFDPVNRKVWMVGDNTGGAKVASLATNSMVTAPFGTDGAYFRGFCKIIGDNVYCSYKNSASVAPLDMFLFNKNTNALVSSIPNSSIPSGSTFFAGVIGLELVDGNIWCYAATRNDGRIAIYNSTLTTLIATITIPGTAVVSAPWGFSRYWQSHYYDKANNKWYMQDIGSNSWYVIDTISRNVIQTTPLNNRQGKSYTSFGFIRNELTNDLYLTGTYLNSPSDTTQIRITYRLNTSNYTYNYVYPNLAFGALKLRPGTNQLWGTFPGLLYNSGNPAWQTDGEIQKYIG